jgi:hypothetical protein
MENAENDSQVSAFIRLKVEELQKNKNELKFVENPEGNY